MKNKEKDPNKIHFYLTVGYCKECGKTDQCSEEYIKTQTKIYQDVVKTTISDTIKELEAAKQRILEEKKEFNQRLHNLYISGVIETPTLVEFSYTFNTSDDFYKYLKDRN